MILKHIYRSDRWPAFRIGCKSRADVERLVGYLSRKEARPEVIRNDFAGDSPRAIADHMELLHRGQMYWAYHVVASHPKGEDHMWNRQRNECIREVHEECGIEMGYWVRHGNHWHGVLLAMRPNGKTIQLGGKNVRIATAFRQLAERWEDRTPGCAKTGRKEPGLDLSRGALAKTDREYRVGKSLTPIPGKVLLRAEVQRIVALSVNFEQLHANADAAGIAIAYKADDQGKVVGVSFSQDGVSLRGKHAGFTYPHLVSLYGQPNPTTIRHRLGVANRISPVDCGKRRSRTFQTREPAERNPETDPRRPDTTGRGHPVLDRWCEAAVGAMMPRTPSPDWEKFFLSLTRVALFIIARSDGRRWHTPERQTPNILLP